MKSIPTDYTSQQRMSHLHFTFFHVLVVKRLELNTWPSRSFILCLELVRVLELCDQRVEDGSLSSIVSPG